MVCNMQGRLDAWRGIQQCITRYIVRRSKDRSHDDFENHSLVGFVPDEVKFTLYSYRSRNIYLSG